MKKKKNLPEIYAPDRVLLTTSNRKTLATFVAAARKNKTKVEWMGSTWALNSIESRTSTTGCSATIELIEWR